MVRRIFVEKKPGFDVEAQGLYKDLKKNLGIKGLQKVRIINRYDIEGITGEEYEKAKYTVFSEMPVDNVIDETIQLGKELSFFAIEYLPGQYDQRADSLSQCIQLLTGGDKPRTRAAKLIVLQGNLEDNEFDKIKNYCINPVECREASLDKPETLEENLSIPTKVDFLQGFIDLSDEETCRLAEKLGLAMSAEDLIFCRQYFRDKEKRNPTITEIRVIDTYWSDHCRHTTFLTNLDNIKIKEGPYSDILKKINDKYLETRNTLYANKHKDLCLMDLATIAMKELKRQGRLEDLDQSDEINACSIVVDVEIDGATEPWLVMFKNETHNHPTEIEPFGGAATCLGGAIRDPLSGRAYVYQAMRVTGSGDPTVGISQTIPGKLPQRKITTGAASGYSSYGNQIGLATGQVKEIYHKGYVAKRMEIGAVIGAVPKSWVRRETPEPGDKIILLGGRTGRDGCGGATGSSKEHNEDSLMNCGAEVQKGNPPTERKIQRLFRNPDVTRLIKKCNDFGAGGVSVAIGELADGLDINLDLVPRKYEGLDGTELAISESQERMAVVVSNDDVETFIRYAGEENLEAVEVARVTDNNRLRMYWNNSLIVDIDRGFLNTNGVKQHADVEVAIEEKPELKTVFNDLQEKWFENMQDLNVCSQKGLSERFDSTIGAGTVMMPFGGSHQLTPAEGMIAKIPVLKGDTNTGTIMTYGYDPYIAESSPFHGAVYAVAEAVSKVVALGGDFRRIRLTFQEYFEKLGKDPLKWGKPYSALLGAFHAQLQLGLPAIGGKDSMSGTFKDMNVPPTLVAFTCCPADINNTVSNEFKTRGTKVYLISIPYDNDLMPEFGKMMDTYDAIYGLMNKKKILAAGTVTIGGVAAALTKMCFGNMIGFEFVDNYDTKTLFDKAYGSLIIETDLDIENELKRKNVIFELIGRTINERVIKVANKEISIDELLKAWVNPLEKVFPTKTEEINSAPRKFEHASHSRKKASYNIAKPKVFIPVFPGTNCEYDTARAFENAGAAVDIMVVKNLKPQDIEDTVREMSRRISDSQIIMIPGGFSGGDEPDGSGKFIATTFRNPYISEKVHELLNNRDGLILGICNGFQALIKLGLLPYGNITEIDDKSPTLTFNNIGRHVSRMVKTRISSNKSPWLYGVHIGDIHTIPISHGEGRFVASEEVVKQLAENGQIATQYVDLEGNPTYDISYNPNGSVHSIEGITSPDGRVFGKMGHSERIGRNLYRNIPGLKDQMIFKSGVNYFKNS